jgi:hypothetical protein
MVKRPDHTTYRGHHGRYTHRVCLLDKNPLDPIKTGDLVEVNATEGMITIKKN